MRHVPLVGDVAAGTDVLAQENVEELFPVPLDFTGDGELFMLRVRGDSMIEAGILDGDFVIAVQQATAKKGDIVVAGIPGGEATVKTYQPATGEVTLVPANSTMQPMEFAPDEVDDLRPGRHRDAPALTAVSRAASAAARAGRARSAGSGGVVSHRTGSGRRWRPTAIVAAPAAGARAGSGGGGGATAAGVSG